MKLKKWINGSEDRRRKYGFYRGLGYSKTAARVLSTVTYGDERLEFLVKEVGGDNVIGNLYDLLREREEESPEAAIRAYWEEKHPRPVTEEPVFGGGIGSSGRARYCIVQPSPEPETEMFLFDLAEEEEESDPFSVSPRLAAPTSTPSESFPSMFCLLTESLSTDEYEPIEEKDAKGVFTAPTSTFRMTTGSASMGIVFNQIRSGRHVRMDQVRIEEVLNYFDYDAKAPTDAKFAVSTELLDKKGNKKLLYINVRAADEVKEHRNIVLLLDTSGSMYPNAGITQEAIATIFSKLKTGDRISLVTYSTKDRIVFEGYEIKSAGDKEYLMGVLLGIEIEGCTFGSAGIETAYAIGEKYYAPDGNNQVILITDGDLNFGITDKRGLKDLIEEKKKSNLFLSVIGTGLYNYKDEKLEVLSKHGNGTYCVVNSLDDVKESIDRRFIALTDIVAKDVKAQVEFNPRFVKAYRLLGYENRQLNHEDFRNDAVISEPYGSGGHGIALYELEMEDGSGDLPVPDLKYQKPVLRKSGELGTVTIRYKEPLGDRSFPIETVIPNADRSTRNIRLAYFLYCLSEKLRDSDKTDEYDEKYLDVMITSGAYRDFSEPNREKLEMLVDAYKRGTDPDPAVETVSDYEDFDEGELPF